VERVEREALTAALERAEGNKAEAARQLQIDYKTMHVKLAKYGLK
jgi:two-component system nitrogen regulation response regulator GlnG